MKRKNQPESGVWYAADLTITAGPDRITIEPSGPALTVQIVPENLVRVLRTVTHAALWMAGRHDPKPDPWAICECEHGSMRHWRQRKSRLGRCHDCGCPRLTVKQDPDTEPPF